MQCNHMSYDTITFAIQQSLNKGVTIPWYSQAPPILKGRGLYSAYGSRILKAILELCLQQLLLRTWTEVCELDDKGESKMLLTSRT